MDITGITSLRAVWVKDGWNRPKKKKDILKKAIRKEFDGGKKAQNTTHGWDLVRVHTLNHIEREREREKRALSSGTPKDINGAGTHSSVLI